MKFTALVAVAVLAMTASSHASFNGFNSAPLGNRADAAVQFATWDIFGSAVISAVAAQSGDLPATLSQSVSSTPPYGPQTGAVANDLFYTFTKATSWSIAASSALGIDDAVLQLKFTTPASAITISDFFNVTLNGLGATPTIIATGVEPGGLAGSGFSVLRWNWSDLGIASGSPLTLNFSSPAGSNHVAIDAISLDVTPVPEPHEYALGMGVLLMAVIFARHRRQRRLAA